MPMFCQPLAAVAATFYNPLIQGVDHAKYGIRPDTGAHFLLNKTADAMFNRLVLALPSTAKVDHGKPDVTRVDSLHNPPVLGHHWKLYRGI